MKADSTPNKILTSYYKGWKCDRQLEEKYLEILNDLAEGIEIKGRLTRSNLIEVVGYVVRQNCDLVEHCGGINLELLKMATKYLKWPELPGPTSKEAR